MSAPLNSSAPLLDGSAPNLRRRTLRLVAWGLASLIALLVAGSFVQDAATVTHIGDKLQAPSTDHWFGSDWLGRDVLARVLIGLRLSLVVGLLAAAGSVAIALGMTCLALTGGRWAARLVTWLVDLFLSLPHLVLLILITFALGGGTEAVVLAVAVTHWPNLTRVLLAKGRVVVGSDYVALSRGFGRGRWWIARRHLLPHVVPHALIGGVLLFPHAILHEAALSFLGLGVDPDQPAVGILLKDSMRYLSTGQWWMALLPGLCLLLLVKVINSLGENLRALTDPRSHHG